IASGWRPGAALVAAGCVILGHMFPVWLGFRGGEGVATALGGFIPPARAGTLNPALLWVAPPPVSPSSSLAPFVCALVGAGLAFFLADRMTALVIAAIALLIIFRHHSNIRRLLAGTESRISFRKS